MEHFDVTEKICDARYNVFVTGGAATKKKKNVKENSIRILEESRTITGSDFLKSMFLSQKTLMS